MTPEEKEALYDKEIAPVLLELGRKCMENDLPFLAVVEYGGEDWGTTRCFPGSETSRIREAFKLVDKGAFSSIQIKKET